MAKKKITDIVSDLASDFLKENGYELYNVEFLKEGRDWFLRVYIDLAESTGPEGEPAYVGTEDCEKVSRFLSEKLDQEDPIEQNYFLEVSSPGLDRPLVKPEHYEKYLGHEVEIKLYKGIDGTKNIDGTLIGFEPHEDSHLVTIEQNGRKLQLKLADIAKANLAVIF
ncbi:MAG: ribosome maturation factor RimP [Eubacteriales bacterium]|nr:ribosome maturation factor RimP [Eubacteriales bacterium]